MIKRILCLLTVAVMVLALFSVSASALVDTTILYGDFDGDKDVDTDDASAVLQVGLFGERGANSLAKIIYGEVSPSGRLPVTFYRSTEDLLPF